MNAESEITSKDIAEAERMMCHVKPPEFRTTILERLGLRKQQQNPLTETALREAIASLEDPTEDWMFCDYTAQLYHKVNGTICLYPSIQVFIKGGVKSCDFYPNKLGLTKDQKRRLWNAVETAMANWTIRKIRRIGQS